MEHGQFALALFLLCLKCAHLEDLYLHFLPGDHVLSFRQVQWQTVCCWKLCPVVNPHSNHLPNGIDMSADHLQYGEP